MEWMKYNHTCPVCRTEVEQIDFHPPFKFPRKHVSSTDTTNLKKKKIIGINIPGSKSRLVPQIIVLFQNFLNLIFIEFYAELRFHYYADSGYFMIEIAKPVVSPLSFIKWLESNGDPIWLGKGDIHPKSIFINKIVFKELDTPPPTLIFSYSFK